MTRLAAGLEDPAEQVADERAAGVADGQRTGRIGRHELDVDARGLDRRDPAPGRGRGQDRVAVAASGAIGDLTLTKPGGATLTDATAVVSGDRAVRGRVSSASTPAISSGDRRYGRASFRARFVAKSPWSGLAGRSTSTGRPRRRGQSRQGAGGDRSGPRPLDRAGAADRGRVGSSGGDTAVS